MKITPISTGYFKLDGGAMFGTVPKSIWNKLNPADEDNLCNWAMRCLLIETGDKVILIDAGIGSKQSEKFFGHYKLNGTDSLSGSLNAAGYKPEDITDLVLTHLHFDHVGGAVVRDEAGAEKPAFANATVHLTEQQWNHAHNSNPRERASFLPENYACLKDRLNMVSQGQEFLPGMEALVFNGHTLGMLCPLIHAPEGSLLYAADLYPSVAHLQPNYVMGYDIQPLVTMSERQGMNDRALSENIRIFFEHDAQCESALVGLNEKGRVCGLDLR
jgi:glyoxylase-like metal-dependent hydrolase (beta-lactamase superfamily II)